MTATLRHLLIQRTARLQERPALTTPEWGTLNYFQFRNRAEGVALGLMAQPLASNAVFSAAGTTWDWISEVAAACCGLQWDPTGMEVAAPIQGGARFNDEGGRQAYHDREPDLNANTLFMAGISHGELLHRLQRLNRLLGWDHDTRLTLPVTSHARRARGPVECPVRRCPCRARDICTRRMGHDALCGILLTRSGDP